MTPKEKAEELLDKMINCASKHDCFGSEYPLAKDCALIIVDEIIEIFHSPIPNYNYWQEVKQEIKKL
jgi:hypothetical protein